MSSSSAIIEALKNSSKGKLIYDRQSTSPCEHTTTKQIIGTKSPLANESGTLAGSFLDVSSVLEDVTIEMNDIQTRRLASIVHRVNENDKISKLAQIEKDAIEDEDSDKFIWISPLKEQEEEREFSPRLTKQKKRQSFSPAVEISSIIENELAKMEEDRKIQVEAKISERKKRMSLENDKHRRKSLDEMEKCIKSIRLEMKLQAVAEKEAEDNLEKELKKAAENNAENLARKAKVEQHLQKAKQIEAQRQEKVRLLKQQMEGLVNDLSLSWPSLLASIDENELNKSLETFGLSISTFPTFLNNILTNDQYESNIPVLIDISNAFAKLIEDLQEKLKKLAEKQAKEAEAAKQKDEEDQEARKREQEQQAAKQQQQALIQQQQPPKPQIQPETPSISPRNQQTLNTVQTFKNEYLHKLSQMQVNKDFKFACQKAVTTPLNAISDVSADHLKDKLLKLTALTNGQPVQATENTRFQASNEGELIYAKNLLAKKLVSHGEEVVSTKPKNAFTAASIVVSLWSQHPDFGQVFLAYLYESCPFLIPQYQSRKANLSDAEYFKSLGYYINDGIIEDKTMFLKRMTGLTRLYAAITISRLPGQDATSKNHPHGLGNLWRLLSSTLNLEPLNDITATVLYDVLSVAGAFLFEKYGVMFAKLLNCLAMQYFPKIQKVTEEGCGGPVARLELFLQKAIASNSIEKPEGLLRADFL